MTINQSIYQKWWTKDFQALSCSLPWIFGPKLPQVICDATSRPHEPGRMMTGWTKVSHYQMPQGYGIPPGKDRWRPATPMSLGVSWHQKHIATYGKWRSPSILSLCCRFMVSRVSMAWKWSQRGLTLQPTYIGVIIHLLSTMDITVDLWMSI